MNFLEYNPVDEKGSCVVRALSKAYDKGYEEIKEELMNLTVKLGFNDYREKEVFEEYLTHHNATSIDDKKDILIKDLNLGKGTYVVFCYRSDFYHMVTIIDNTLYDKNDSSFDLQTIRIYKIN